MLTLQFIKTSIPEVEHISPRLFGPNANSGDNTIRGIKKGAFNIYGENPEYFFIDPWTPIKGRLINQIDIQYKRKVCMIGERVVEVMFEEKEDPIGQYLKINGVYFQVIGVIHAETRVNINGGRKTGSHFYSIFNHATSIQLWRCYSLFLCYLNSWSSGKPG